MKLANNFLHLDTFQFLNLPEREGFLKIKDEDFQNRSSSAKLGWMKYRVNYKIGNMRESIQNSLGIDKSWFNFETFKYH